MSTSSVPLSPSIKGRPLRSVSSSSSMPSPSNQHRSLHRSISSSSSSAAPSIPLPRQSNRSSNLQHSSSSSSSHHPTHAGAPSATNNNNQSMTIEEMRLLHRRALKDAEAKRTELRLVLASRYRELVGSSDEVLRMRERSEELHQLLHALPALLQKLHKAQKQTTTKQQQQQQQEKKEEEGKQEESVTTKGVGTTTTTTTTAMELRHKLNTLPRIVHRALDKQDVHTATVSLIQLFQLIASQTSAYPLANALGGGATTTAPPSPTTPLDPILETRMKMTFLHVQTLPARTQRMAKRVLLLQANFDGAQRSAAALSALELLRLQSAPLLDLYFDSKAKLLQSLLNQLSSGDTTNNAETAVETDNADVVLSKIVAILQHDIILHPYQIFVLRKFPGANADRIVSTLPHFDPDLVKSKASHFLAAHLPLIRTKVKSVLVSIAGTTASALGHIRQSLYDKTDGDECMALLDSNGVCTWDDAVNGMVNVRVVLSQQGGAAAADATSSKVAASGTGVVAGSGAGGDASSELRSSNKFSLWSALFSNTFSSLVHNLLTTSFHSVHVRVVSTLRTSLANAPPFSNMLPHEAYRNTLKIAADLDAALSKVSSDAHELLVHAEERAESERRLRQSLYVQTCEIMGRLVCELRRMLLLNSSSSKADDATKEFVVGRLCHLLKFRLTSLPTLLNPQHSPAVLGGGGMITLLELQSAFDLADDNDDGLITFEEAMEAVDSAFSGTPFHGAEMIRETLLLTTKSEDGRSSGGGTAGGTGASQPASVPSNVTLEELALLSARGLKHEKSGTRSALGTIQRALDDIIDNCFTQWSRVALAEPNEAFVSDLRDFFATVTVTTEAEWQRIFDPNPKPALPEFGEFLENPEDVPAVGPPLVGNVSSYATGYLLALSSLLNRSICPSDATTPTPSAAYSQTLGLAVPSMMATIRVFLLRHAVQFVSATCADILNQSTLTDACPSAMTQLKMDFSFLQNAFFERNQHGFEWREDTEEDEFVRDCRTSLEKTVMTTEQLLQSVWSNTASEPIARQHAHVWEVSGLFYSSLLGDVADDGFPASAAAHPLLHNPLPSSRRFGLLPIQSDRSLAELQRRGKFGKDKNEEQKQQESSSGVIGSGLGFFSSMLKKK